MRRFRTISFMSETKGFVASSALESAKKALIVAGFAAVLGTVGTAVAAADPSAGASGSGSTGPQCEHYGIPISCQVGAVSDTDGTQGSWRTGNLYASQGTVDSDNVQGTMRSSTQGTTDDDGFQGAYANGSTFASPQLR